jgi:hypothetical protein
MPPPDPTPDPNAAPSGIQGLLGNLFPGNDPAALYTGALTDPATRAQMAQRGLLAMAGSFADSAMPTRMPTPLGAVLGHAAAALGTSNDAVMAARLQAAQTLQAQAQAALSQQDVEVGKGLLGAKQDYDTADRAIPGTAAAAAVPVTGTIGASSATTAPVDTGRGPPGVTIPPGTPTATFDPKLPGTENINNLINAAAPIALPPGYTIKMTSSGGYRPGAKAPGGGASQHATANAADFQIFKPDGTPIPNTGEDSSTLYGKVALTARMIADPAIKPWLAWGGNFSTASGARDLMHFDFAGDRGHFGTLGAMEQQFVAAQNAAKPVQVASAAPSTMTDAAPAGAAPGPPPPLGPSGRTISQLADQAMADRPPAPGGLINGPPPPAVRAPGWSESGPQAGVVGQGPGASPNMPIGNPLSPIQAPLRPPLPPPGAPPPATVPPGPQSLIPQPAPPPPVPPIARPQAPQVAPLPATPAPAVPTIPGAPSPAKIAAAQRYAALLTFMKRPVPPDVAATATYGLDIAKAAGTKAVELPYTPFRPNSSLPIMGPDGRTIVGWQQAPSAPTLVDGPPDAQGRPTKVWSYPSTTPGAPAVQVPIGPSGASPREVAGQQAAPKPIELDPTKTVIFPPSTPGAQQWIDAQAKGQKLPDNVNILANGAVQVGATTPTTGQIDKTQEDFFKLKDSAQSARQGIYETQQLRQQLHQIGMSGPATEAYAHLGAWAQSLGILTPDQVKTYIGLNPASAEAAEKMSQDLLGEVLKSTFPARITNADISNWKNTVPRGTMLQPAYDLLIDKILMPKLEQQVGRYGAVAGLAASGDPQLRTYSGTLETYDKTHPLTSFVHQYIYGPGGNRLRLDKDAQGQPAWVDDVKNPVQP